MTHSDLARDYFIRAKNRYEAIKLLFELESYPDVVRESQKVFELILKGYLRLIKIDPPKWHDVGQLYLDNLANLSQNIRNEVTDITEFSRYLRKERENAFYGDDDMIPMSSYSESDAKSCLDKLAHFIELFKKEFQ